MSLDLVVHLLPSPKIHLLNSKHDKRLKKNTKRYKQEEFIYNIQYDKEKIEFQGATVTVVLDLVSSED